MKRPSTSARPMKGRTTFGDLARRDVDGEGHEVARERELHLLGDGDARLVLGFGRRAPRWGTTTTEGRSKSGDSVVGSFSKTSSAAPWT